MLLPDRGRLGVLPLPALLLLLHRARFSGSLRLSSPALTRTVELSEGHPLRVRGDGLCARLVAAGLLSQEDAVRATARAREQGGSEAKALLALRLLAPRDLWTALREYERELLLDCFAWPEGEFELAAGETAPAAAAALAHDPVDLVHSGVSAHWNIERTLAALGAAGGRFAAPGPGFEEASAALRPLAGFDALCSRLDGKTRLVEAAQEAGHAGALAAALILDALGALAYTDEPAASAAPDAPPDWASSASGPGIEIVVAGQASPPLSSADAPPREAGNEIVPGRDSAAATQRALLERHARLPDLDHYALLGVPHDADSAAIRRAYLSAAKTYHPDATARLGLDDLRETANALFARISRAHAVLSDPAWRRKYDQRLEGGGADDAQRIASAEIFYRKGEVLLRKGSFDKALAFLRPATELVPEEALYRSALGWSLYKKQQPDPDAARSELERAIALDPASAAAHQRLGTVLQVLGKAAEAAAHLARAQELESRGTQAR
jgi:tetratricopeptide (TPR) repeat protein